MHNTQYVYQLKTFLSTTQTKKLVPNPYVGPVLMPDIARPPAWPSTVCSSCIQTNRLLWPSRTFTLFFVFLSFRFRITSPYQTEKSVTSAPPGQLPPVHLFPSQLPPGL